MNDAEKVREALYRRLKDNGKPELDPFGKPVLVQPAGAALDSILTELAEAKQQQFTIQELRARSDAVAAAEERAEQAETALENHISGGVAYVGRAAQLEARIQELEAENDRLRQGLVEALEEQS